MSQIQSPFLPALLMMSKLQVSHSSIPNIEQQLRSYNNFTQGNIQLFHKLPIPSFKDILLHLPELEDTGYRIRNERKIGIIDTFSIL